MNTIECSGLTHYYGRRQIYKDLSFVVPEGHILGLLGKNGTGKTTTINLLNGFLKPHSGQVRIFGEDVRAMRTETHRRIGLLLEGHVQYQFMTIEQLERFYAPFYPDWKREAYYELLRKLKVDPAQRISRMSNGQRSQVALGIIMAQNPDLLILDDFSLGLDPGYRRLFVDYLREYACAEKKTMFLTSHIIQDMERLIDDCIIMDYGRIMTHRKLSELMRTVSCCSFAAPAGYELPENPDFYHPERKDNRIEFYTFLPPQQVQDVLKSQGAPFSDFVAASPQNLEDIFIGLTGKY